MPEAAQITHLDLALAFCLVVIAAILSRIEKLGLERDMLIGALRTFVQLMAVGYALRFILEPQNLFFMPAMMIAMTLIASYHGARQGRNVPHAFLIAIVSIGLGAGITLGLLVLLGIIAAQPRYVVPIFGMIIGNCMNAVSLVMNRLLGEIRSHRLEIEAALALGATSRQAAEPSLRTAAIASMIPTVNMMMTIGIVAMPGMMTGQIIGGGDPVDAVAYQIVVIYMLAAAVAASSLCGALLTVRQFFTRNHQLLQHLLVTSE